MAVRSIFLLALIMFFSIYSFSTIEAFSSETSIGAESEDITTATSSDRDRSEHPEFRVNLNEDSSADPDEFKMAERVLPQSDERIFGEHMLAAQQQCLERQYEMSLEYLDRALAVLQKHLSPTDTRIARCRMRIGAVQFLNRNFDEAVYHLRMAASGYEHHELYNENCIIVYQLLGESYYELLNLPEAEGYAWKALSLAADQGVSSAIERQEILRLHFRAALAQNDPLKVSKVCDEHLRLLSLVSTAPSNECKNPREAYECFLRDNRFWALLVLGQKEEAAAELDRAAILNDKLSGSKEYSLKLFKSLHTFGKTKNYIDGCVAQNGMVWSRERMPIKVFIDDSIVTPEIASVVRRLTERALTKWNDATGGALHYSWASKRNEANMLVAFKTHYRPDGALARTRSTPIIGSCLIPDVLNTRITIDLFLQETAIPSGLRSYGKPLPAYHYQDAFELSRRRSLSPRAEAELSAVILHEMGHALGIRHSSDPRDLMYFTHFCNMDFTPRDIATARIWYGKNNFNTIQKAKDKVVRSTHVDCAKNLKEHPTDYYCLTESGRVALRLRKYAEARKCFERAIEIAPKNPTAYFNLGLVDMATDHNVPAIANFRKAQSCDSRYATADIMANIATCQFRLKNYVAASDYSDLALRKQPSFRQLHQLYASALYEQKRFKEALTEIERYLEVYPSSEEGYLLEGKILSELHDFDNSIKAFDHSLALNPKNRIARQQRDLAASHLHGHSSSVNTLKSTITTARNRS